jgi:hypothetical protein
MDEDSVSGFIAQAAELDPAVRERVIGLANLAIDQAEYLMRHGDPRVQVTIVRSFMTILAKQMQVKKVDGEIELLKVALGELTEAVMGYKQQEAGEISVRDPNSDAVTDGPQAS